MKISEISYVAQFPFFNRFLKRVNVNFNWKSGNGKYLIYGDASQCVSDFSLKSIFSSFNVSWMFPDWIEEQRRYCFSISFREQENFPCFDKYTRNKSSRIFNISDDSNVYYNQTHSLRSHLGLYIVTVFLFWYGRAVRGRNFSEGWLFRDLEWYFGE